MKIVSLNLWLGGVFLDNILEFLKKQDADIVLLQEVYNGTDRSLDRQYRSMEILQELGYEHTDFVADYRDYDRTEGKAQRGNAILSKFPIVNRAEYFLDKSYSETYRDVPGSYHKCPRDLQHVTLATPGGELNVFNLHGVWDLDGDSDSVQRQQMSNAIIAATAGKKHVVLGGDSNAKPTNPALQRVEQHLTSVFGNRLKSTFNMRHKDNPGYATAAVDVFFVSDDVQVLSADCLDVDVSDHLPLVMTIALE